jgi:hypothetical protein
MLHHFSMTAENPQQVAKVFAELWEGASYPFPVYPNSYVAFAGDDRGTMIEVYPLGSELHPGHPELPEMVINSSATKYSATHVAIAVSASQSDIERLATREGWFAQRCDRGPFFTVMEFWVENRFLVELLTPEMASQYVNFATKENWESMILTAMPS